MCCRKAKRDDFPHRQAAIIPWLSVLIGVYLSQSRPSALSAVLGDVLTDMESDRRLTAGCRGHPGSADVGVSPG